MANAGIAKIFRHGRSQAVRLPLAFRLPGTEARVRRAGKAVILEPIEPDLKAWFAELDALGADDILPRGRRQPRPPIRRGLK
jgi:antitoxin VapB